MKLSSVLKDWPEKKTVCISKWHTEPYSDSEGYINSRRCPECKDITSGFTEKEKMTFNTALTLCDREIDREALIKVISEYFVVLGARITKAKLTGSNEVVSPARECADHIISTMPTWLKPTERK